MLVSTPRLLITDDDRDFRETVAGVLNDRGFETLQAGDGEEALHIIRHEQVHLILLDMQMPRLSGLETIERLRELEAFERPKIALDREHIQPVFPLPWILISGALDEQLIERAKAAFAFSVLPKPLRLPDLTGAVTSALAQAYNWPAA
jgi:CheY-like chemotaxis protein